MATDHEEVKDTGVPSNDAYTGMLVISLLALIIGRLWLFLDYGQCSPAPPKTPGLGRPRANPAVVAPVPAGPGKDAPAVKDAPAPAPAPGPGPMPKDDTKDGKDAK